MEFAFSRPQSDLTTLNPRVNSKSGFLYEKDSFLAAYKKLSTLPKLVSINEILNLEKMLEDVSAKKKYLIQMGDCVELFQDAYPAMQKKKLRFINSISSYLEFMLKKQVVSIGRIGGQYAKPRSSFFEPNSQSKLISFMGEMINGYSPNIWCRSPKPERILWAYYASLQSINAINLFKNERNIFSSHEGLNLLYESALCDSSADLNSCYNLSSHMQWLGIRSIVKNDEHIEFYKNILNPVGVKIGPNLTEARFKSILIKLNKTMKPSKLILITRFGSDQVQKYLPKFINIQKDIGTKCLWVCDPMHGNTVSNRYGVKTRPICRIISEIKLSLEIHQNLNSHLSGLHLEASADDILECANNEKEIDKIRYCENYQSKCDPRLNYEQTLKVVNIFANKIMQLTNL